MGEPNNHIVLYRKYRSRSFDEVVGQDHIVLPLKKEIAQDRIAHAYLFTGPRGVGKTSIARIFAFAINGMEYSEQLPIDIIEIDGASNRRIDEIRELKERIHIAPVQAKYKVYIIDEVHMLTKEAFNALLKTLEEPPAHAVFILATTESHKMPATIISRTQRHSFRSVSINDISTHLGEICTKEGVKFEDDALKQIAYSAGGSLRDAISLLDQVSSLGDVSSSSVESSLGTANTQHLSELINAVESKTPADIVGNLEDLTVMGGDPTQLSKQLIDYIRSDRPHTEPWFMLIENLINISSSLRPDVSLEIALLRANNEMNPDAKLVTAKKPTEPPETKQAPIEPKSNREAPDKQESAEPPKDTETKPTKFNEQPRPTTTKKLDDNAWQEILEQLKKRNNALYSVLRMSKPKIVNDSIDLPFKFEFHRKQAQSSKNASIIAETISQVTGKNYKITTSIADKESSNKEASETKKPQPQKQEDSTTSSVLEAMGGGEVVQL